MSTVHTWVYSLNAFTEQIDSMLIIKLNFLKWNKTTKKSWKLILTLKISKYRNLYNITYTYTETNINVNYYYYVYVFYKKHICIIKFSFLRLPRREWRMLNGIVTSDQREFWRGFDAKWNAPRDLLQEVIFGLPALMMELGIIPMRHVSGNFNKKKNFLVF